MLKGTSQSPSSTRHSLAPQRFSRGQARRSPRFSPDGILRRRPVRSSEPGGFSTALRRAEHSDPRTERPRAPPQQGSDPLSTEAYPFPPCPPPPLSAGCAPAAAAAAAPGAGAAPSAPPPGTAQSPPPASRETAGP